MDGRGRQMLPKGLTLIKLHKNYYEVQQLCRDELAMPSRWNGKHGKPIDHYQTDHSTEDGFLIDILQPFRGPSIYTEAVRGHTKN